MKYIGFLKRFFAPSLSRGFIIRLVSVVVLAFLVFKFVFIPMRISNVSMAPTYENGQFIFGCTLTYRFSKPEAWDVVMVELAGRNVMFLKRVVAEEGDTVAFKEGTLYVNGKAREEPYVAYPCDWDLEPRTVDENHVYVVGDNRRMKMANHRFGETPVNRIAGTPLW